MTARGFKTGCRMYMLVSESQDQRFSPPCIPPPSPLAAIPPPFLLSLPSPPQNWGSMCIAPSAFTYPVVLAQYSSISQSRLPTERY